MKGAIQVGRFWSNHLFTLTLPLFLRGEGNPEDPARGPLLPTIVPR